MGEDARTYNLWLIFRREAAGDARWSVHCLELDVVAQGRDLRHACDMAGEAIGIVLLGDLRAGQDPFARRAPPSEWEELYRLVRTHKRIDDINALLADESNGPAEFATSMQVTVEPVHTDDSPTAYRLPMPVFADERIASQTLPNLGANRISMK